MPRACLVYNPSAGRFPSGILADRAAHVLRMRGWEVLVEKSTEGADITRLARRSAEAGLDAFFIAGGDGSINLAAAGLIGSQTALGVLPSGTSNVLAQEIGLPGLSWTRWFSLEESAKILASAPVRRIDVGVCNGAPFVLWAGVGLDGFVINRIEPRHRWEKQFAVMHFATTAVLGVRLWHGMDLKVVIDGSQSIDAHYLLALVSNVHLYAGGAAELSPDARLDDGKLDLWLFQGDSLLATLQRWWDLYSGHHLKSDQVAHFVCETLVFESVSPLYVQADGEPLPGDRRLEMHVESCALSVLVPEKTPHVLFSQHDNLIEG